MSQPTPDGTFPPALPLTGLDSIPAQVVEIGARWPFDGWLLVIFAAVVIALLTALWFVTRPERRASDAERRLLASDRWPR